MQKKNVKYPNLYRGITISSTFTDLKPHRAVLMKAITAYGMMPVAMENDTAKVMDIIDSSLQMVRNGSAYIGIIGKKYGQIPKCLDKNPNNLSITELEFDEALKLNRPILIFIASKNHLVLEEDIETNREKKRKLNRFIERCKKMSDTSHIQRVYCVFDSIDDFKVKIGHSLAQLSDYIKQYYPIKKNKSNSDFDKSDIDAIPVPPKIYVEPAYTGTHHFIGRQSELDILNDWGRSAYNNSILIFDGIGGIGKSTLAWEWVNNHARNVRNDWAGIFWYSFYEEGATMSDFCRRALAYISGRQLKAFQKKRMPEMRKLLMHHLYDKAWLFILDGLERVLVAYHRIDAHSLPDEELVNPQDQIVNRNECLCINKDDDELIRSLASSSLSKILITSRLTPQVLVNSSGQPIVGVYRVLFSGLRSSDAEIMFRSCGINGNSDSIQDFLIRNCGCHPLTIGVLAGLVNDYLPCEGNFDVWLNSPLGGMALNFAHLDLVQRRTHILEKSIQNLSLKNKQLLSIMAFFRGSIDYDIMVAVNPFLSHKLIYSEFIQYSLNTESDLIKSIQDLKQKGLLQYDQLEHKYDLHPVIRNVILGELQIREKEQYGQKVLDYFSQRTNNFYENAESLDDVQIGINIVSVCFEIGKTQKAFDTLFSPLIHALIYNLEAVYELLPLLKAFFPNGWDKLPILTDEVHCYLLFNYSSIVLYQIGEYKLAVQQANFALKNCLKKGDLFETLVNMNNVANILTEQRKLIAQNRILHCMLVLAEYCADRESATFLVKFYYFIHLTRIGKWEEVNEFWQILNSSNHKLPKPLLRLGAMELYYSRFLFYKGELDEENLIRAESAAEKGLNRLDRRMTYWLRGMWQIDKCEWESAMNSLSMATSVARSVQMTDFESEAWLAFVSHKLDLLSNPISTAKNLTMAQEPCHRALSELWYAMGNLKQAKIHALAAYKEDWADGEPFVFRYRLNKDIELLLRLGMEIPQLPVSDPTKDLRFEWEETIDDLIQKLKKKSQ